MRDHEQDSAPVGRLGFIHYWCRWCEVDFVYPHIRSFDLVPEILEPARSTSSTRRSQCQKCKGSRRGCGGVCFWGLRDRCPLLLGCHSLAWPALRSTLYEHDSITHTHTNIRTHARTRTRTRTRARTCPRHAHATATPRLAHAHALARACAPTPSTRTRTRTFARARAQGHARQLGSNT